MIHYKIHTGNYAVSFKAEPFELVRGWHTFFTFDEGGNKQEIGKTLSSAIDKLVEKPVIRLRRA